MELDGCVESSPIQNLLLCLLDSLPSKEIMGISDVKPSRTEVVDNWGTYYLLSASKAETSLVVRTLDLWYVMLGPGR